jgi:hypothetical protein
MKHNIHSRGDFLNKPFFHSDGTIFSKIVVDERGKHVDFEPEFKISDCSSTITLSFYLDKDEDYENGIHKINTMINHLEEFKEAFERGGKLYLELQKTLNQNKNEHS